MTDVCDSRKINDSNISNVTPLTQRLSMYSARLSKHLLSLISLCLLPTIASAADITLTNPSFELPGTSKQFNWSLVPGWSSDTVATDSGVETGQSPTNGLWTGFIEPGGPAIWQLSPHTITSGDSFTLTLDAKSNSTPSSIRIKLYYDNAGTRSVVATKNTNLNSSMQQVSLTFSADDIPASIGNNIGIEIDNPSSLWIQFDNIKLSYTNSNAPYAWYRSDTGITTNTSGNITTWASQTSTSTNLINASGSPRLSSVTTTSGSVDIVTLNGSSSLWAPTSAWGSITGDRTVACYARLHGSNDGFLFDGSTGSGLTRAQVRSGNWQAGVQSSSFSAADTDTTSVTTNTWQAHIFQFDENAGSTTVTHWIDGTQVGTHSVSTDTSLGGLILGSNGANNSFLAVDLTEVQIFNTLLTSTQRSTLTTTLSTRFGNLNIPLTYQNATTLQQNNTVSKVGTYEVAALQISSTGSVPSSSLTNLTYNLNGTTDIADIDTVYLYDSGSNSTLNIATATLLAQQSPVSGSSSFTINQQVSFSNHYFWIVVKLAGTSAINDNIDAEITGFSLTGSDAGSYTPTVTAPAERLTVSNSAFFSTVVRTQGQEGVHTYRIPGLATSNNGTLIAVFDIRHNNSGDLPGNIDVGCMRSTDGGFTWGNMITILDYDSTVSGSSGNGVGDPTVLVDRDTGRIWCAALYSFGNNAWNGSGPGLAKEDTGQYVLTYSDDDGLTWSAPTSITSQIKDSAWNLYFNGPGKGFTTRDGTLVFPSQYRDAGGTPRSNFIYSTDHGSTWHHAAPAIASGSPQTTEAQMVELDSGDLLISMRNHQGNGKRLWCIYSWDHSTQTIADGSWGTPWFEQTDPVVMASVERYRSTLDGHPYSALLFSNPDFSSRQKMSIRLSLDEGLTWPYSRKIDDRPAAYSCMTRLPNGDIGILYETGTSSPYEGVEFARFPVEWITGTTDTDSDGLTDFEEDVHGLDKNNPADAAKDTDADGVSNIDEIHAGTNPSSRSSVLKPTVSTNSNGKLQLSWPSTEFTNYRIETSTTLESTSWTPVSGLSSIQGTGTNISQEMPANSNPKAFYRIVIP